MIYGGVPGQSQHDEYAGYVGGGVYNNQNNQNQFQNNNTMRNSFGNANGYQDQQQYNGGGDASAYYNGGNMSINGAQQLGGIMGGNNYGMNMNNSPNRFGDNNNNSFNR